MEKYELFLYEKYWKKDIRRELNINLKQLREERKEDENK